MHWTRHAWPWAAVLLPLLLAGLAAAQDPPKPVLNCSITIRQPSTVSYTTIIDCRGDEIPELVVVVQNATAVRNNVTYTLNDVVQQLGTANFVEDGSQLWAAWAQSPALVGMGMTAASTQQGTLIINASVVNIALPQAVVQPSLPGPVTSQNLVFSALRFSTISNVDIVDSVFEGITSTVGNQAYSAVVWTDDQNMNPDFFTFFPAISVTNSAFSRIRGFNTQSGALMLNFMAVTSFGAVSVIDSNFTGISANSSGAAMYMDIRCPGPQLDSEAPYCPSLVTVRGCRFTNNNSTLGRGGALYVNAGNARIEDSFFTNNRAASSGGALLFESGGVNTTLDVVNTVFRENVAGNVVGPDPFCNVTNPQPRCNVENECGGAMRVITSTIPPGGQRYWSGSATVTVTGSQFIANRNNQVNTGGAVCIGRDQSRGVAPGDIYSLSYAPGPNSTVLFHTTSFIDNYVPRELTTAGAVFDFGSQGMTFDNCTFRNNTAGRGAAIYSLWATYLNITGNTIFENHIVRRTFAGAIGVSDLGHSLIIDGAIFRNSSCNTTSTVPPAAGGAIFMERQLAENPSLPNYTATITNTVFFNNSCQEAGAVYIRGVGHTIGPNVLFDSNNATLAGTAGGALYIQSLDQRALMPQPIPSTITGTIFRNNTAPSNGGALYTRGIWRLSVTDTLFFNNSVSTIEELSDVANSGGAAYINALFSTRLNISHTNFTNNTAFQGGALAISDNNMTMTSCLFDGNRATGEGGGMRIQTSEPRYQVNITSSTFTNNLASTAGALQAVEVGMVLNSSTFEANHADLSGGALSVESCAPTGNNTMGPYSPAVGLEPGAQANVQAVYLLNNVFQTNTAEKSGGGAALIFNSRVIMVNNTFVDNGSNVNGGALSGQGSTINDYVGNFTANRAAQGGAIYTESCNTRYNDTLLRDNGSNRGGALFLGLARADYRRAGAFVNELNNCTAHGNFAESGIVLGAGYGGCLALEGVNVTIVGGSWVNNTAAAGGGVIDARGQGSLVLQSVRQMEQSAALSDTGGAVNADGMAFVLINNTVMRNNTALLDGGCMWAGSTNCVIMLASNLTTCTTTSGSGGGAWIGASSSAGCSGQQITPLLDSLSRAGINALPSTLTASVQGAGRRLLQTASTTLNVTVNLLAVGSSFTSGRAVNGGNLAIQMTPSSGAVLDQLTISGGTSFPSGLCLADGTSSSTASNGGGLYVTMLRPALAARSSTNVTCRALNDTATVSITTSALTGNVASSGNGGAAAVLSVDSTLNLQTNLTNCTVTNNTAANGGALSVEGAGAFLSITERSSIFNNTATPPGATAAAGASGGCIYGSQCQGLMLRDASVSGCQAAAGAGGLVSVGGVTATSTGRSLGGGVMTDGCTAVVLDRAYLSNSSAGAGGGLAARDTRMLLVVNSTVIYNTATAANVTSTTASTLDGLRGVGGGLWISGSTTSLLRNLLLQSNAAGLLAGGAAAFTSCNNSANLTVPAVPPPVVGYAVLNQLRSRAVRACYATSVQSSSVTDNVAQGSGGAFFASSNSSLLLTSCNDIQSPISLTSQSLNADLGAVTSSPALVATCPTNRNRAVNGYGPIIATLPATLGFNQTTTQQQLDPSRNGTDMPDVPLIRFIQDGSFVLPSTSPLTPAVMHMRVLDAAGQDVRDPFLSNMISVEASSNATRTDSLQIYGQRVATYNTSSGDFVMDGISLRGVVGANYTFDFAYTSDLLGGATVDTLRVNVIVPDCADGEIYTDDQHTGCRTCSGSFYAFFNDNSSMPAPDCLPCPTEGSCSGGAVLVPADGLWHSAPNSTEMHQCQSKSACARSDDRIQDLQNCQRAWYEYKKAVQARTLTEFESEAYALMLLERYNCSLYSLETLTPLDPRSYLNLLCADGYGGNLCGVCVPNSAGKQTALRSNQRCSECSKRWVVYLVTAFLYVINLAIILLQVFFSLGEQMLASTIQFADIFGAIINHIQYLIVVLKLQFEWPSAITEFHKVISATVSFADDAIKFASITCLSDGSPEAQAEYQMGGSLTMPLILIAGAVILWCLNYFIRQKFWYPYIDKKLKAKSLAKEAEEQSRAGDAGAGVGQDQVMVGIAEEEPETPGGEFQPMSGPSTRSVPGPPSHVPSGRMPAGSYRLQEQASEPGGLPPAQPPPKSWADAIGSTLGGSTPAPPPLGDIPAADASDDAPPPEYANQLNVPAPSLRRNHPGLRKWHLPGAEKLPEDQLWFTSKKETRALAKLEEDHALTLVEKFRLVDEFMTIWQQILAVVINGCFVVYQGWVSAALSPFSCQQLDDGQLDPSTPADFAYYANFELATNPYGYWQLNMNQACYKGEHLTKWTPIGAIMSFVLGFGIPLLFFLPVFLNRKTLTKADTQLRWGWLYIRFYYGRVPYWMAVQALELFLFIIVQTFSNSLPSVTEQAALLQLTLVLIVVFNTCMWPIVHPLLTLTSFLSNATLIFTLGLAIIIGDGVTWQLTEGEANTTGAFIIIINSAYVVLLIFLFYKHMRDVIAAGFLDVRSKAGKVVSAAWKKGLVATRNLRTMNTVNIRAFGTMLKRSKKDKSGAGEKSLDKTQAGPPDGIVPDSPVGTPRGIGTDSFVNQSGTGQGMPGRPVQASS